MPSVSGLVAHAQWCSTESARLHVLMQSEPVDPVAPSRFTAGELFVLSAPLERIGDPERLVRGWVLPPPTPSPQAADGGRPDGRTPDAGTPAEAD
jgi:hypothetical protein